jgi:hypothetical protein
MRRFAHQTILVAIATLALLTGCVQGPPAALGNRVGVALTVNGGSAPTSQQIQLVLTSIRPELERQGFILVTDLSQADRIIRVDFTPDEFFPEIAGSAIVLGWRVNPATYRNYGSGSYAYQPFMNAYYASTYGYDRYGYDYNRYDSRGYTTSTTPPYHNSKDTKDGSKPEDHSRDHARRDGDRDGDKNDHRGDGNKSDRDGDRNRGGDNDHHRDHRPPPTSERPQPTYVSSPSNSGSSSSSGYSSSASSSSYSSSSSSSYSSSSYSSGSSSYSSSSSSSYSAPTSSSSSSSSPSTTTVSHQNE